MFQTTSRLCLQHSAGCSTLTILLRSMCPSDALGRCVHVFSTKRIIIRSSLRDYHSLLNPTRRKQDCAVTLSFYASEQAKRLVRMRYVQARRELSSRAAGLRPPWRTMFFGTDDYALAHLKVLNELRLKVDNGVVGSLEVVSPQDTKCPVRRYAESSGLTVHSWPLPLSIFEASPGGRFDVGVVVSFGHLIPKRIIDAFPFGILNVHPSILPRWRGASPIIHTILNGDRETGISIMEIRPSHFDVGPLLLQTKYSVPDNCTSLQLRDYLAIEGCSLLTGVLENLRTLEKFEYEQNFIGITYAHKLTSTNARVNWEVQTSRDIDRQYRALSEIFGLRSQWQNLTVRLLDMVPLVEMAADDIQQTLNEAVPDSIASVRPGLCHYHDDRDVLCIRCRDGWVGFRGITIKKPMTAKSFYNGYLSKPGNRAATFASLDNGLDTHLLDSRGVRLTSQQTDRPRVRVNR